MHVFDRSTEKMLEVLQRITDYVDDVMVSQGHNFREEGIAEWMDRHIDRQMNR